MQKLPSQSWRLVFSRTFWNTVSDSEHEFEIFMNAEVYHRSNALQGSQVLQQPTSLPSFLPMSLSLSSLPTFLFLLSLFSALPLLLSLFLSVSLPFFLFVFWLSHELNEPWDNGVVNENECNKWTNITTSSSFTMDTKPSNSGISSPFKVEDPQNLIYLGGKSGRTVVGWWGDLNEPGIKRRETGR